MLKYSRNLDPVFHALADANRRRIVSALAAGPASVSEIAAPMEVSLAAVLQHLKVLEAAGLVTTAKTGRVRTCTLDSAALSQAELWIADRRRFLAQKLDALATLLERNDDDQEGDAG